MTFYTVAKVNFICGPTDHKIGLSKGWSYANILISSTAFAGGISWYVVVGSHRWQGIGLLFTLLTVGVPLYIWAILFTVTFLHYDTIFCCCCDCFLGEEQMVIHDPSNPEANLVLKDGKVSMLTNYCQSRVRSPKVMTKRTWADTKITRATHPTMPLCPRSIQPKFLIC